MKTIYEHEVELQGNSLSTYLVDALILIVIGLGTLMYNINSSISNFEYVLGTVCILFIVVIPLITMRSISEERKQHTDNLLYSLPLSMTDIVVGKYLASVSRLGWPLIVTAVYPLVLKQFGNVYLPTAYGSLIAFFLLGASFTAIGLFISSLTESQGLAAGLTAAFIALDYFIVSLSDYASGTVAGSIIALEIIILLLCMLLGYMTKDKRLAVILGLALELVMIVLFIFARSIFDGLLPGIMNSISLYERFYTFVNGVFDVTAIVYYLSVTALFIFLTVQVMEKRRYN